MTQKTTIAKELIGAAQAGHLDDVKDLLVLPWGVLEKEKPNVIATALSWAALNGHEHVVTHLIPLTDPKKDDSLALRWAAGGGHLEIFKRLLPLSEPEVKNSQALQTSAGKGHLQIVKALLPLSKSADDKMRALTNAAENGHTDVVKIILKRTRKKTIPQAALQAAAKNGHHDIIKLLAPRSDVERVFKAMLITKNIHFADNLSDFLSMDFIESLDEEILGFVPRTRARLIKGHMEQILPVNDNLKRSKVRM